MESSIWRYAVAGLLLGLLVDLVFLKKWLRRAYSIKPWVWMAIYGFYSTGVLGFFMGVPLFNLLLAIPAGVFLGRWLAHSGADAGRMQKTARRAAVFTTSVLALVCLVSAAIALVASSTASEIRSMFALPFEVTRPMLVAIIVAGGAVLLRLDWWLTTRCVRCAYEYFMAQNRFSGPGLSAQ